MKLRPNHDDMGRSFVFAGSQEIRIEMFSEEQTGRRCCAIMLWLRD